MPLRISACVAITAQQFCSIETAMNFLLLSGISKTAVWKKQDAADVRELQTCGNVPARHASVDHGLRP